MPEGGQIVVTGASKGIGAAVAVELERRGFAPVSLSRSGTAAAGRAMTCDMTDEASVKAALAEIAGQGPIIGLVNNAGLHKTSPSHVLPTADYEEVMRINATAVMIAAREAFPYLKATCGRLVNMGSFFDKLGVVDNLAYCASKAAVGAMTRCLAVEWARHGINVINVAPGYIETDLNKDFLAREKVRQLLSRRIPTGGPGAADEVARFIASLFVEDIRFLTGETIYIDGGQGMNH
jgi:NAD(P)-dependent dehydrogenase (short-subunit alcohol dehydrogenase family)